MDDFILFSDDPQELKQALKHIETHKAGKDFA